MTARSSGNLYQPLKVGNGHLMRMDDLMWPSYRRRTLEMGGSHDASFIIDTNEHDVTPFDLERWFTTWIGCRFVESYGNTDTFTGFVNSMTLYIGGVMRTITLDNMWNTVSVIYQPNSSSAAAFTAGASDATSIARFGTKAAHVETREYTSSAHAIVIRDNYLDRWKMPRVFSIGLEALQGAPVLEVQLAGYIHTLGWQYYNQEGISASTTTVSTHITGTLLSGVDFITTGDIDTVSTSITDESDYKTRLLRLDNILDGLEYRYGCYGGTVFDLKAQDYSSIKYRRRAYTQRQGFLRNGRYVPEPLVTPSGWVFTDDIFASQPVEANLRDDPRADWIASVEYSNDGVILLNGEEPEDAEDITGIGLALSLEAGETTKPVTQPWLRSSNGAIKG